MYLSDTDYAVATPTSRGSMTLLELPERRVGVTCRHVIDAYLERVRSSPAARFVVGRRAIEPLDRLLVEDARRDLAIIDLDDIDPAELGDEGYELEFFPPPAWPLGTARPGEILGLGGYMPLEHAIGTEPGENPLRTSRHQARFDLDARVLDVGGENIVCEVRLEGRRDEGPYRDRDVVAALGGLSGGAGFVSRDSIVHFVGIVFAVAEHGGYLRLRPADLIGPDATLRPD